MKIIQDVRDYARDHGLNDQEALEKGMEEMSEEFVKGGSEVYLKGYLGRVSSCPTSSWFVIGKSRWALEDVPYLQGCRGMTRPMRRTLFGASYSGYSITCWASNLELIIFPSLNDQ
jgi:hypothetical protein